MIQAKKAAKKYQTTFTTLLGCHYFLQPDYPATSIKDTR